VSAEATLERLRGGLAGLEPREVEAADGMPTLEVARDELFEVARRLRDDLGFEMVTIVTAVDLFPATPRFRAVHQFLSLEHGQRVRLHTLLEEEAAVLPSVTPLWPGAGFFEREVYDLFGIRFEGHPDLRRLLMPEGYTHHPLRKDFPHQGIEPDRLYREWDKRRREGAEQA
jgi:NADH-quinone oxidoreductase subunit C